MSRDNTLLTVFQIGEWVEHLSLELAFLPTAQFQVISEPRGHLFLTIYSEWRDREETFVEGAGSSFMFLKN